MIPSQLPDIAALEARSHDYSETPRRVLFVLGGGEGAALEVFRKLARLEHTSIESLLLEEMAAGRRRSLVVATPMQMVPEIVAELALNKVAIYQVQLLD